MSISPQTPIYNHSTQTQQSSNEEPSKSTFRDLLRVNKSKDKEEKKSLFKTLEEEEDAKLAAAHANPTLGKVQEGNETQTCGTCTGARLSPEIEAIFEKMASCMLVMTSSREVKTTLCLDHPRFASSVFFGSKITIREFSTAPKMFNVEIVSNPLATAMIDAAHNDLLSAFQYGKFPFSIQRLDTQIETGEPHLVHRKESSGEEQSEEEQS